MYKYITNLRVRSFEVFQEVSRWLSKNDISVTTNNVYEKRTHSVFFPTKNEQNDCLSLDITQLV